MKNLKFLILGLLFISFIFGCTGIYEDGSELAKDYSSAIEQISVDDFKAIEESGTFLLVDVRQPTEYYTNKIEGSVLIPRGDLEFKINDEDFWFEQYMYPPSKDSTEIIIYCKSGKRGILAAKTLMELGYKDVKNLEGGYDAYDPNRDPNAKPQASSGCGG